MYDDSADLAVCWECDVEIADCVVVQCAICAWVLGEGQTAAGLLGCVPNLPINYTTYESNNNTDGLSSAETSERRHTIKIHLL